MATRSTTRSGGLVYSTEHGRMCPDCRNPIAQCTCRKETLPNPTGPIRVRRETQGRKGKGVTVIMNLPLNGEETAQLCTQLKKKCGSGGTAKGGTIEIQGDHCEMVLEELAKRGWIAKRSGGSR